MERKKKHREKENGNCERWIKKGRREIEVIVEKCNGRESKTTKKHEENSREEKEGKFKSNVKCEQKTKENK